MTYQETPRQKFTRQPNRKEARQRFVDAGGPDGDRVLTFSEWCGGNGFSIPTGRRLKKIGKGPDFILLGTRTLGVTIRENRRWQASRTIR